MLALRVRYCPIMAREKVRKATSMVLARADARFEAIVGVKVPPLGLAKSRQWGLPMAIASHAPDRRVEYMPYTKREMTEYHSKLWYGLPPLRFVPDKKGVPRDPDSAFQELWIRGVKETSEALRGGRDTCCWF